MDLTAYNTSYNVYRTVFRLLTARTITLRCGECNANFEANSFARHRCLHGWNQRYEAIKGFLRVLRTPLLGRLTEV